MITFGGDNDNSIYYGAFLFGAIVVFWLISRSGAKKEEKCNTGFILKDGKCVAVTLSEPAGVPAGTVPLITPNGVVAVPAAPVNIPVVPAATVNIPQLSFERKGNTNRENNWRCGPVGTVGNGYGCGTGNFCTTHNWCESDRSKHTPNADTRYRIYDGPDAT